MSTLRERTYRLQRADLAKRIERHTDIQNLLRCSNTRVADIGCGRGFWLEQFQRWGVPEPKLFGLDLDAARIRQARSLVPRVALMVADARRIPLPSAFVTIVTQFTLFTSLRSQADRLAVAREMLRVLKPGGLVLWYDFFAPNPLNRNTRRVTAAEIRHLFLDCHITLETTTLLPPLARILAAISWRGVVLLERIPMLRTHYFALIRKPA